MFINEQIREVMDWVLTNQRPRSPMCLSHSKHVGVLRGYKLGAEAHSCVQHPKHRIGVHCWKEELWWVVLTMAFMNETRLAVWRLLDTVHFGLVAHDIYVPLVVWHSDPKSSPTWYAPSRFFVLSSYCWAAHSQAHERCASYDFPCDIQTYRSFILRIR